MRAQRTAEILRKHILHNEASEIVLKRGLIERDVKQLDEIIDKKDYEPEKLREQMEMEKMTTYEDYMSYQFKPSEGNEKTESLGKVRDRALETLITIGKELKENIAIVASHGNLMKALSIDEAHKHQYRLTFRGFDLKPCGVMVYKFSADTKKITLIACDKFSLK